MNDDLKSALAAGKSPGELGFFMPAETAPHAACWMSWPHDATSHAWQEALADVQTAFVDIATAISGFEPVRVIVHPDKWQEARTALPQVINLVSLPADDLWFRDTGPCFLKDGSGRHIGGRMRFNNWGEKFPDYAADAAVAEALVRHLDLPLFSSALTGEGGGIHVDGEGTVVTTETFLLNPNRNPGLSKAEVEHHLFHLLGARKVIWLPGDEEELITDGHIDGVLTFCGPGRVICETNPDRTSPRYKTTQENLKALEGQTDAKGQVIEILRIDEAYTVDPTTEYMATSYVNAYIANGGIVLPEFGAPTDAPAREAFQTAFPDRRIATVNMLKIAPGGGGIHCMTQQQPA